MGLFAEFISEIKLISAAAAGLKAPPAGQFNQITSIQGASRSFVEQIKDGRLALPLQIFNFGSLVPETDLSMNSLGWYRAPGVIISVHALGGPDGNQDAALTESIAIKTAIDSPSGFFTNFSTREEGQLLSNVDAPVNAQLLAASQARIIASAVSWQPGFRISLY